MSEALSDNSDDPICKLCNYPGSDLRVVGCGCTIHARCAPLSLVLELENEAASSGFGAFPSPTSVDSVLCPCCKSGTVNGLYLFPLSFRGLERAVELRKSCALAAAKVNSAVTAHGGKRPRDEEHEAHAESSYVLLSNSKGTIPANGLSDRDQQRTGRWTDEEINFVDYMVNAFDQGSLPLPHGIKLNEFLGDMLLCKSSRLTKKMKNAKLSTRSFKLASPEKHETNHNCEVLSGLQEKFLITVPSEATQLELRFNVSKQWRKHFSNLCLQVGYSGLNSSDWIASLEEMERRASNAEDNLRRVRRRRMGLALRTDGGNVNGAGAYNGVSPELSSSMSQPGLSSGVSTDSANDSLSKSMEDSESGPKPESNQELSERDEQDFLHSMEVSDSSTCTQNASNRARTFSEDFESVLRELEVDPEPTSSHSSRIASNNTETSCGPFLDAILTFLEQNKLPFHHVDVWVPSFLPEGGDVEHLRLFNAGHATRGDLIADTTRMLQDFGAYSSNFNFEPDQGIPGRVYSSGKVAWERGLKDANPKQFERTGVRKFYGINTAMAIPLNTPLVGRIIIVFYSLDDMEEDPSIVNECSNELLRYSPEPKWKLVIDMNEERAPTKSQASEPESFAQASNDRAICSSSTTSAFRQKTNPFPNSLLPEATLSLKASADENVAISGATQPKVDQEEQHIVSLLSDHMPISDYDSSSSGQNMSKLLPHFMTVRLLLLRPLRLRTAEENEMIEILKSSYRAYSIDNRRSGAELATLLAQDWICLMATYANANPSRELGMKQSSSSNGTLSDSRHEKQQSRVMQPLLEPASFSHPQGSATWTNQSSSRAPSLGVFGYDLEKSNRNAASTMAPPQMSPNTFVRRSSFGPSSLGRGSSFETKQLNQRISNAHDASTMPLQPMSVHSSSHVNNSPKPLAPKPNVVLEH